MKQLPIDIGNWARVVCRSRSGTHFIVVFACCFSGVDAFSGFFARGAAVAFNGPFEIDGSR